MNTALLVVALWLGEGNPVGSGFTVVPASPTQPRFTVTRVEQPLTPVRRVERPIKTKIVGSWNMEQFRSPIPGFHSHHCEKCGFVWSHPNTPKPNKIEDHICPHCGALPPGAHVVRIP